MSSAVRGMDRPRLRQGKGLSLGAGISFSSRLRPDSWEHRGFGGEDRVSSALTQAHVRAKVGSVGPLFGVQATGTTRRKGCL